MWKTVEEISRNRSFRIFALSFAGFFLAIGLWSLATPPIASPDEATQVTRAAAIVRGQLTGKLVGVASSPYGLVRVPAMYANFAQYGYCFLTHPSVPASCTEPYGAPPGTVEASTYVARYQPFYYAIMGLPTLLTTSLTGFYLMRLESAAINSVFLALSVMAVVRWSRSRLLLGGIIAAATPTVLFFGGMVNPIGLEVSTAICLWTTALILARERLKNPPRGLVVLLAITAGLGSLTRSLSPFWEILSVALVLIIAQNQYISSFIRRRFVIVWAILASACGLVASLWIIGKHALNVVPVGAPVSPLESRRLILWTALSRTEVYFKESIGVFGMLDVFSPNATFLLWTIILLAFLGLSLYAGTRRERMAISLLVLAIIFLQTFISYSQAKRLGIVWQGSDTLPLFVGVPLLCATVIGFSRFAAQEFIRRWFVPAITVAAAVGSCGAFFASLRRYAVGVGNARFDIFHTSWQPLLGVAGLLIAYILTAAGIAILIIFLNKLPSNSCQTKRSD